MPVANTPIEPVERLMVVVGLRALISRAVEKFKRSHAREFDELPKEVAKLAGKLVGGELVPGSSSDFNYRSMLKELARGWDPEQVTEMMASFPPGLMVYSTALLLRAKTVIEEMQANYPQTNYVTATGSINLVPADKKIFRWTQVMEVLVDPLSVFSLMQEGALLQSQVKAMRTVYPSLSTAIDAALLEATVKEKAKTKSFELAPRAEIGVRAWFGKGPLPLESLKKAQAANTRANERRENQQAAPTNAPIPRAQQTLAQRVESA